MDPVRLKPLYGGAIVAMPKATLCVRLNPAKLTSRFGTFVPVADTLWEETRTRTRCLGRIMSLVEASAADVVLVRWRGSTWAPCVIMSEHAAP